MNKNVASRQVRLLSQRLRTWARHIIFPNRSNYQKGFAAIEAVLIIIIVAIIGGTGYYVWHSKDQTDKTLDIASKTSSNDGGKGGQAGPQTGPAKNEVYIIPEWKVSATIPTPPKDAGLIQYKMVAGPPDVAQFTTQELVDLDSKDCGTDNMPAGTITRALGSDRFLLADGSDSGSTVAQEFVQNPIQPYKVVDKYYYWYTSSQSLCSDKSNGQQLQQDAASQVKAIVSNLEQE